MGVNILNRFKDIFTKFFLSVLGILMIIVIISSIIAIFISHSFLSSDSFIKSFIITALIITTILLIEIYCIRSNLQHKIKLIIILICGLIIRGLWLLNIKSIPTSDFMTIYNSAQELVNGDTSMFWGNGYIARFPHLTIMVVYMAFMIKSFPINNLMIMKFVNLTLGVLTIYLIYLIVKEVFNSSKKGAYAAVLASIFPSLVTYTGILCTENIAIPLYLISTYMFILAIKNKKRKYYFILSGVMLSLGNLFRIVATIMIIAYTMYVLIYSRDKLIYKFRNIALYIIPYFLILILVSNALQGLKITEYPLWKGSEPKITNVLKGTNMESLGRWNEEDAAIIEKNDYDYEKIEQASINIIKERLTTTPLPKLMGFFIEKFAVQWSIVDSEGIHWTKYYVPKEDIIVDVSLEFPQIIYCSMMILVFLGILNRKKNNEVQEINLFYIILCGYIAMNLITESQGRYSYIASWLFIILSIEGINFILNKFNKDKKLESLN